MTFEREAVLLFVLCMPSVIILSCAILLALYIKTKNRCYKYFIYQFLALAVSFFFLCRCLFPYIMGIDSNDSVLGSASLGFCGIGFLISTVFFFKGLFEIFSMNTENKK